MPYFNERHNLRKEYSGHDEVSAELKRRLLIVAAAYSASARNAGKSVALNTPYISVYSAIESGNFGDVFTAVEVHLAEVVKGYYSDESYFYVHQDYSEAFRLSGSVYGLDQGQIILKVDGETADQIDEVGEELGKYPLLYGAYSKGVKGLLSRETEPADVVKDFSVALDGYLKELTGKTYGEAVKKLVGSNVLDTHHKSILEKLHLYRSDSFGTTHAGNSPAPTEIDALWYLRTMMAIIQYIHARQAVVTTAKVGG